MLVIKDDVCKKWQKYFKGMTGDYGKRDVSITTIELELRKWNRYRTEENITKEEVKWAVMPLNSGKAGGIDGAVSVVVEIGDETSVDWI